ncbi:MAG TPA: hypothetical protein PK264_14445 [Hyphomicrobiaceae bacterium]|nr:hypothetical protein [Hyphomicrobiaceae bacterium]
MLALGIRCHSMAPLHGQTLTGPSAGIEGIFMTGGNDGGMAHVSEAAGHGGTWAATMISAAAFVFSGISFYMSALQRAELEVYVPPVLQYARDGGGDVDVFAIPITIANNGANTGAVLALELVVENVKEGAEPKSKTFYSAFMGEHPRDPAASNKTFAAIAIPGRGTFSDTVRFYPRGNPLPKIVQDAGEYRFTLRLVVAEPPAPGLVDRMLGTAAPAPITFTRTIPYISEQHLGFRRGTVIMHDKDWKPMSSAGK